eukprot:1639336-Rhodomonas_salina.2
MARGYAMVAQGASAEEAGAHHGCDYDSEGMDARLMRMTRSHAGARKLQNMTVAALGIVALLCFFLVVANDRQKQSTNTARGAKPASTSSVLLDTVLDEGKEAARDGNPLSMLAQATVTETEAAGDCDEACKMIQDRVKRAWTVGMAMFQACGDRKLEGCGDLSKASALTVHSTSPYLSGTGYVRLIHSRRALRVC